MKRAAQYLFTRNGVYQYRQTIPKYLRVFYTRKEFRVSLRTRSPRQANYLAIKLMAEIAEQFNRLYMSNKDDQDITGFVTIFDPVTKAKIAEIDYDGDVEKETQAATAILSNVDLSSAPLLPNVIVSNDASSLTLEDTLETHLSRLVKSGRLKGRDNSSFRKYSQIYAIFADYMGNRILDTISIEEIEKFYDDLKLLPSHRSTIPALKTLSVKDAMKCSGLKRIAPSTRRQYFQKISSFFIWAVKNRLINHNPCEAVTTDKIEDDPKDARSIFTSQELKAIFVNPYFTEHKWKKGKIIRRETYRFWLPIIGALTGARLGELCDLTTSDVKFDGLDTWYIVITNPTDNDSKSIKNDNSARNIPIHSKLISMGFLDYVNNLSKGLLFNIQNSKHPNKAYSNNCSKRLNNMLATFGVHVKNEKVFHSFRHTFITDLVRQFANSNVGASITGHLSEGEQKLAPEWDNTYNKGFTPAQQKEVIEMISYTDVFDGIEWK